MRQLLLIITCLYLQIFPCLAAVSVIERMQQAQESIVEIKTELTKILRTKTDADGIMRQATFQRSGAGVIIDSSGLIVTNTHTIINAPFIFVILSTGEKLPAQVAYVSPSHDFSFLTISTNKKLRAAPWADSDKANLGERVIGIGNSIYNNQSLLSGQITSFLQSKSTANNEFIETDLHLYHGDSGDPIFNSNGQLLGIIMANRKSQARVSLAIASNKIREQYLQYKRKLP